MLNKKGHKKENKKSEIELESGTELDILLTYDHVVLKFRIKLHVNLSAIKASEYEHMLSNKKQNKNNILQLS
jgi:hypothetical protein